MHELSELSTTIYNYQLTTGFDFDSSSGETKDFQFAKWMAKNKVSTMIDSTVKFYS